jgi:hypothetical protein
MRFLSPEVKENNEKVLDLLLKKVSRLRSRIQSTRVE